MSIQERIVADIKEAMKAKDKDKLRVLRSLKAKLMEKEISERKEGEAKLSDEQSVEVLMKAAKQRKESIEQFEEGDREDLAENEKKELALIEEYLPEMMDEEEVRKVVREKIKALSASGPEHMGKVMGPLMGQLKGKADGSLVSKIVKEELGG
ncbi:MAG TPA: GatB/YqeY domain-containing protein [Gracilimonas sp.]|uniref:GatB/YqeY domain-containing protein n=1 Tax=Gracilimonas sp. TaxID=1974203 RepID=UPI002D8CA5B5|nr:GatB/YqeY domain-containing protein [Gracilimonas sp.]